MGVRLALIAAMLLSLAAAAPAAAHELAAGHSDFRGELAFTSVAGTVETVDRAAGTEDQGLPADVVRRRPAADRRPRARPVQPVAPAVQGRLRLRERRGEPLRGLEGRAAGRRVADRALHGRAVRRPPHAALRHGHELRARLRRRPGRRAAAPARVLRRPRDAARPDRGRRAARWCRRCPAGRATCSCSATGCRPRRPATGPASARAGPRRSRAAGTPTTPAA